MGSTWPIGPRALFGHVIPEVVLDEMKITVQRDAPVSPREVHDLRMMIGWPSDIERQRLEVSRSYANFVVRDEDRLVGYLSAVSDGVSDALLRNLMVHPDYRMRGIGRALLAAAVRHLSADGVKFFSLVFPPELDDFYRKCGFAIIHGGVIDLATEPGKRNGEERSVREGRARAWSGSEWLGGLINRRGRAAVAPLARRSEMKGNRACCSLILGAGFLLFQSIGVAQPRQAKHDAAVKTAPDYADLRLQGDMETQNSYAVVMQAAGRLLGKEADYADVFAWSTAPFAPCFDPGEPTKYWWAMCKDGGVFEIISGQLGLNVDFHQVDWSRVPKAPPEGPEGERHTVVHAARPTIAYARNAMNEGKVCLSVGAWPSELYPWCMWGIVTRVVNEEAWVGAGINGRTGIPIKTSCGHQVWALTPAEPRLTPRQGDLRLLEAAVRRIRGQRDPGIVNFLMDSEPPYLASKRRVYGVDAMDRWIAEMSKVPWSRDPNEGGNANADTTASWVQIGSRAAAAYLRDAAPRFRGAAREHLDNAAEHYERIVDLLDPAITGRGGDSYDTFMGDLERQNVHVRTVLEPVKERFVWAADQMDKAVAAAQGESRDRDR